MSAISLTFRISIPLAYQQFRDQMLKYHLGSVVLTVHTDGPILLKNGPLEVAAVANQLQRDSKLPLLIAADFERGLDSRVSGTPAFPDAMAFGAIGDPDARGKIRRHRRRRSTRDRNPLELFSRRGCEQQSRQSDYQHAFLFGETLQWWAAWWLLM